MNVHNYPSGPFRKFLCILLAVAMATGPTAQVVAQQQAAQQSAESAAEGETQLPENATVEIVEQPTTFTVSSDDKTLLAAPDAGKINLTYVTPQAVALAVIRPRQLLTSPNTALLPVEVASAAGVLHLGIDPVDITEIVVFAEPPSIVGLQFGAVVKFAKPFTLGELPEQLRAHTQPTDFAGKQYLQSVDPRLPSLYMPNEDTLLVMSDVTLKKTLAPLDAAATSPLLERLGELPGGDDLYAVVDVAALRPLVVPWLNVAVMQQREKFPEEAKPFLELPNLISAIDLAFNITNRSPTLLALHANDAASADRLEKLYDLGQELQRKNAAASAAKLQQSDDPIERAFGKYVERMANTTTETYKYERSGDNLVLFQMTGTDGSPQSQLIMIAVVGMLVALILPAIQAAREAARRNQSINNLKQLILSMLVYADSHKVLPPHASYSPDGKPLLSWRVHMLPYLEEGQLYAQFKLDESWDSPHNRALIPLMPEVFANPNLGEPVEGKTNYLALVGPECVLDGSPQGLGFAKISDGTSNTIVIVEADADQAVEWTKPDDIEFDPDNLQAGFGKLRPGGCNAAFCDSHVAFISEDIDPAILKAMVTRNGRETIKLP